MEEHSAPIGICIVCGAKAHGTIVCIPHDKMRRNNFVALIEHGGERRAHIRKDAWSLFLDGKPPSNGLSYVSTEIMNDLEERLFPCSERAS